MDYLQLLQDVRTARTMLNKAITRLENNTGDNPSFMIPAQPRDIDTVIKFIELKLGVFAIDMATASQMCETLKDPYYAEHLLCPADTFSPVQLGRMLKKLPGARVQQGMYKRRSIRLCVFRNVNLYNGLNTKSMDIEYATQMDTL